MINVHIVKRYLILADSEIVERYDCPMDPEHGRLFANLDVNDRVFTYCLYCKYKDYLGLSTLQKMSREVLKYDVESDLRHLSGL
jgi:hypothetical protein